MTTCSVNTNVTLQPTDTGLSARVFEKLKQGLWNAIQDLRLNAKIHEERRQLAELTERQLRDMGITRGQAVEESREIGVPRNRRGA